MAQKQKKFQKQLSHKRDPFAHQLFDTSTIFSRRWSMAAKKGKGSYCRRPKHRLAVAD